jgi:hypothetical protein
MSMKAHLLLLALPLVSARAISAQGSSCIDQIRVPAVGQWAEYQAVFKQQDPYTMRYAVIGEESRGGKALKWVELRMTGNKKDGNMVTQMLVPGSAAELGDVQEVVMKPGDKPAMKIDGPMLAMIREQMKKQSFLTDLCKDVTLVGGETVTVPAGKFKSQHFRSAKYGSDSWVSSKVPFSMIKTVGTDHELTLVRHGDGAESSITEEPKSMGGP